MRPRRTPSLWIVLAAVAGMALLAGCATTDSSSVIRVSDVKSVAGKWAGVVERSGSNRDDFVEMMIRDDGTYDVTASRTIGTMRGNGTIVLQEGQLMMRGTHGRGVGTLMGGPGGQLLKVDVTFDSPRATVSANLRPVR
jgi:hypothetical protein